MFAKHDWPERGSKMMQTVQRHVSETYGSVENFLNHHKKTAQAMTETVTNELILEHLKRLQEGQSDLKADMREVKQRLGSLEEGQASLMQSQASLSRRIDRMGDRLDRIERRLDLAEAPAE